MWDKTRGLPLWRRSGMRSLALVTAAGLSLAPLLAGSSELNGKDRPADKAPAAKEKKAETVGCGDHGTAVQFFDTPSEAAKQAKKDQKLVFVLHVSGLFEDPKLT